MEKLSNVQIIDGFAQSNDSYGQAIGAANAQLEPKMVANSSKGVVSSSKTYSCYITLIITSYDI